MVPHILAYIRGGLWGRNAVAEMFPTPSGMRGGIAEVADPKRTVRKRPTSRPPHRRQYLGSLKQRLLVHQVWSKYSRPSV